MTSSSPRRGDTATTSSAADAHPTRMICQQPNGCAAKAVRHAQLVQQWMPLGEALHEVLLRGLKRKGWHLLGIGQGRVNARQVQISVSASDIVEVIRHGDPIACFVDPSGADLVLLDQWPTRTLHVRVRLSVSWPDQWRRLGIPVVAGAVRADNIPVAAPIVLGIEDPANNPARWQASDNYSLPHCFCSFPPAAATEDTVAGNS